MPHRFVAVLALGALGGSALLGAVLLEEGTQHAERQLRHVSRLAFAQPRCNFQAGALGSCLEVLEHRRHIGSKHLQTLIAQSRIEACRQ